MEGTYCDGSAFGGTEPNVIYDALKKNGYHPSGREFLFSGITGEAMQCYVFTGPIYYMKLKHMVADKIQARARGKLNILTRQPTEGRAKEGGLRLGEMERDCLVAYGASNLMLERLCYSSDVTDVKICKQCGLMCDTNYCRYCDPRNIKPTSHKTLKKWRHLGGNGGGSAFGAVGGGSGAGPGAENSSSIITSRMPYACKLLIQEMQSMNVVARLKFDTPQ